MKTENTSPAYSNRFYTVTASLVEHSGLATVMLNADDSTDLVVDSYRHGGFERPKSNFIVEIPYTGWVESGLALAKVNAEVARQSKFCHDLLLVDASSVRQFSTYDEAVDSIPKDSQPWVQVLTVKPRAYAPKV